MENRKLIVIASIIVYIFGMQDVGKYALYILQNTIQNIKILI